MTNETEAPERIWAAECRATNSTMWWPDDAGGTGTEYIRADLSAAKDKRIEELEAKLRIYEGCNGQPVLSTGMIDEMAGALKRSAKHIAELKSKLAKVKAKIAGNTEHAFKKGLRYSINVKISDEHDVQTAWDWSKLKQDTLAELTTNPTEMETP